MLLLQSPSLDMLEVQKAKSLSEAEARLASSLAEGFAQVEARPHKRLWKLLGHAALRQHQYAMATKAFVLQDDYKSVQFVKQVRHVLIRLMLANQCH